MLQPEAQPKVYSQEGFGAFREYALLAEAGSRLFDAAHKAAILKLVTSSNERIWPLDQYALAEEPASQPTFRRYGASAFTQETLQDLKHHASACEIYLALQGCFRIKWKPREAARFECLEISAAEKPWALIPPEHCLLVVPSDEAGFLAVAFKTELSKIGKGKFLGSKCERFADCQDGKLCEELRTNRSGFFDSVEGARQRAIGKVGEKAASL